ncbi:3-dehydroquinate synthase [Sedimentisphaera cyanobacteriorum]|uniref:3-dehydroquinate synthase n=1 Tax=Sedimentisphaera cyanobacteriorum TaxID=1940790 RepID=A0A1Q2HRJ0_9BACT|nr:3-dehydroquinate synthase [Sedimentisphaera cyanobacteriorum]AQQ10078.1 3-dehydroquinate synthase [Sedimentisphaera cyanobacteriorum]
MEELIKFNVKTKPSEAGEYPVVIGSGIISKPLIESFAEGRRNFIVTDENVESASLCSEFKAQDDKFIISPAGEISKNIKTVIEIVEAMEAAGFGRDSVITGLGGGTVGDMAGFAAAIFKRGVPVIHIPTSTVAQADSSIGGKTGVDSSISKNAFGAFHHPAAVIIDTHTLKTLPEREYLSGLAESVKHGLIMDSGYFSFIENNTAELIGRGDQALKHLAKENCRIKARVVEEDPCEKNQRRILNYGHTIGHAVETLSNCKLLHGECVSIGIIAAGLIEIELGIGSKQRLERIENLLNKLSLPVRIPDYISKDDILSLIKHDKKAVDGWPRFALIEDIGKAYTKGGQWAHPVNARLVESAVNQLKQQAAR